jgi:hypothetical protein
VSAVRALLISLLAALALPSGACCQSVRLASTPQSAPAPAASAPIQAVDAPRDATAWETPAGWRTETIPFPLEFAPSIAHAGVEELRFPPGFLDPESA